LDQLATISYSRSKNELELLKVLELQKRNTRKVLPPEELRSEGFVTVVHDLDLLKKMQQSCPHILAKKDEEVVGYALAMVPDFRAKIPVLVPLFELVDRLLPDSKYLVMGQICIDKSFRGKGIFSQMYRYYRDQLHTTYDCLVTEVSSDNQRSLQAHLHVGFERLYTHVENEEEWITLVWNW
jgi:GNAT superfamily N-acetyltransferase